MEFHSTNAIDVVLILLIYLDACCHIVNTVMFKFFIVSIAFDLIFTSLHKLMMWDVALAQRINLILNLIVSGKW